MDYHELAYNLIQSHRTILQIIKQARPRCTGRSLELAEAWEGVFSQGNN